MRFSYNLKICFLMLTIHIFLILLVFPQSENISAFADYSNILLSDNLYQNIAQNNIDNNKIPNQFIVYLKNENEPKNKSTDPLEFFNSELKDTGTELLQVYNHVAKGFAIKVPNEKILEELKKNPLVEYIGQDKKITALNDSSIDSQMAIQIMP